jgi:hypothetical protein
MVDDQLTNALVGAYIFITTIVSINIFISLLASTVTRTYDQALAYSVYQRAIAILNDEKSWSRKNRAH